MGDITNDADSELAVITAIIAALSKIEKDDARARVLAYVNSRFSQSSSRQSLPSTHVSMIAPGAAAAMRSVSGAGTSIGTASAEIPGIGQMTEDGGVRITARDLKAKSGLDAAVRLAHIATFLHQELTGLPISSRKALTPLLKQWRLYDGNTRARLAKERGLVKSGDSISLDAHARRDAERFVQEILDDAIQGQWKPR